MNDKDILREIFKGHFEMNLVSPELHNGAGRRKERKMKIRWLAELNESLDGRLCVTTRMRRCPYDGWGWEVESEKHITIIYPWSAGIYFDIGYVGKSLLPVVSLLKRFGVVRVINTTRM